MSSRQKAPNRAAFSIEPSGFFVLRTPLLPWGVIEQLGAGTRCPALREASDEELAAALIEDRRLLRERLAKLIDLPEVREALFIASPTLMTSGVASWKRDPDSKKGRRAEQSLLRYVYRMASRPTPFGLFSGCTVGEIGDDTCLQLVPREAYRRHTRPDMEYLEKLTHELATDPSLRKELTYRPNSSLYRIAGKLRYAESRHAAQNRSYHLLSVDEDHYLASALRAAEDGASLDGIAQAVVRADPDGEVTEEEAAEFVAELIDGQLLIPELTPPVTGEEPLRSVIAQLEGLNSTPTAENAAQTLAEVRDSLRQMDASGVGNDPAAYSRVVNRLASLPVQPDPSRLVHVDLYKPGKCIELGRDVVEELSGGLEALYRLSGGETGSLLDTFHSEFLERYHHGQLVPLTELLDEETGIGFGRAAASVADDSPLLDGLALGAARPNATGPSWTARESFLLRKVEAAVSGNATEIELHDDDLSALPLKGRAPLPRCFHCTAILAAKTAEAARDGAFQVYLRGANGPSGAKLLGRFCHGDARLGEMVREHLRAEEAVEPEGVYAEVVHLPEGRMGNLLCRPVLREYEIPYLGSSGALKERQLPIQDLLVTVWGERVELISRRLGKKVIPRLTSAHNYSVRSLSIYRFLCSLQNQGLKAYLGWNWGALLALPFLPRVRVGRCILAVAQWNVQRSELQTLLKRTGVDRLHSVRRWREERNLPRVVVFAESDHELVVDLENDLSVDAFLAVARQRHNLRLHEMFPAPADLLVEGPEGRFVNELIVPLISPGSQPTEERYQIATPPVCRRTYPPGSEWLYTKVYTGEATADYVLRDVVGPVCRKLSESGVIDRWFFIRYADPHWHLRVRLHGDPGTLHEYVLPLLESAVEPVLRDGAAWKFQIDTYEREIERYGGDEGIELAESIFYADSEAVLSIIECVGGDSGADVRWRLALKGLDQLLGDFGFDLGERLQLATRLQGYYANEFGVEAATRKQISKRLRSHRQELRDLLYGEHGSDHPMADGLAALTKRSYRIQAVAEELKRLAASGSLTARRSELVASFAHMFTNRLLRADGRAHEVVLYDFLTQMTRAQIASERAGGR